MYKKVQRGKVMFGLQQQAEKSQKLIAMEGGSEKQSAEGGYQNCI